VVIGPTNLYGAGMGAGLGEKGLPAPSMSDLSPVCCDDRMGAEPASVGGAVEDPGTDRVDSVGVVRTDWPSQKVQEKRTKRNSVCFIKRKNGCLLFQGSITV
jgi:hypothetical protein